MPGEINCIFTKGLIPFVEGGRPPDVTRPLPGRGRSRDYLMADHNWLPLSAPRASPVAMELMGHGRRGWAYARRRHMEETSRVRHYLGTYSMGIGNPRSS